MKTTAFAILLFVLAVNSVSAQSTFDKWPAIKEFHAVMSQTFHPAEEGNLEPIKSRAEELANKASALTTTNIPAEFRTKEILASIDKLQINSKNLQTMVSIKAADANIMKSLSELHDIFHEIVGLCSEEKK